MDYSDKCSQLAKRIKRISNEAMQHHKDNKEFRVHLLQAVVHLQNALTCYQWLTQNDDNGIYNTNAKRYEKLADAAYKAGHNAVYAEFGIQASAKDIYKILHSSMLSAMSVESVSKLSAEDRDKFTKSLSSQWKSFSKAFDWADDRMPDIMAPLNKADRISTGFAFKDPKPADIAKLLDLLQESKAALDAYIEDLEQQL